MTRKTSVLPLCIFLLSVTLGSVLAQEEKPSQNKSIVESDDFAPQQDSLPVVAPEDAIVLFGVKINEFRSKTGSEIDWPVENGALVSSPGNSYSNHIVSLLHFRDADIHVEFMLPEKGVGNSGIYIHGNYEMQIIQSHQKEKIDNKDMGALYGFAPPLVNAARPRDQWQVYDIRYRAPRRDASGKIIEKGSSTAWLNGRKVQDHTRFGEPISTYHPFRYNTTPYLEKIWELQKKTMTGHVVLQDHGNAVRFRNVWVKPLDDKARTYQAESK